MALTLALAFSLAYPAQALTVLDVYATARFERSYPVYSGPGTYYYRANSGKATYGGGVARVYGVTGDWIMIGYEMGSGDYRIGYITRDALPGMYDVKGTVNYSLSFSGSTLWAGPGCALTDDPIINCKTIYTIPQGTTVTALGTMGTEWTYVEVMGTSSLMRGFVRSRNLSSSATGSVPTSPPIYPTATPAIGWGAYPTSAPSIGSGAYPSGSGSTLLRGLTHNCPNTGIMLPASFSPYQTTYLLTVADWVSRPTFTPVADDANATITVNGQVVRSGQQSQAIVMTDKPQAVSIVVSNRGASTTYTVYLQRRPSEKRTRVSAGYVQSIFQKNNTWYINADLVTIQYRGNDYTSGNLSTFRNVQSDPANYAVSPNCAFYYGTKANCYRAYNIQEFINNYLLYGSSLYTYIFIEDEIVAVLPYGADY